jgi:hypothetical protein
MILNISKVGALVIDNNLSTIAPILSGHCLSCHSGPPNTKLNYSTTLSWVNSTLIKPADALNSRLITAITTAKPAAMSSISLSTSDLAALKTWINQVQINCPLTNSIVDPTKVDGCFCKSGYDDIRSPAGQLTECKLKVVITCTVPYSQIDPVKPDGCGCVTGFNESRNAQQKLTSCTTPTFAFNAELKRYHRCYGQFTRSAVLENDQRVPKILAKTMTGTQACMDLLKKASLNTSGRIKANSDGSYDLEGMQILSTFQKLHMSWFSNHNWSDTVNAFSAFYRGTQDLFYTGESALLMTNALFNTSVPYSSIVTSPNAYEAIRSNPTDGTFVRALYSKYEYFGMNKERLEWTPNDRIETGNIIGIRQMEADQIPYILDMKESNHEYKLPTGGGVLGSNVYFMLNQGRDIHAKTNGGLATYRRWSKFLYKDILCRDIPVIRSVDVSFLKQKLPASTLPFRNGNSCLQCHFSIDGLAGIARNKTMTRTGVDFQARPNSSEVLSKINSLLVHHYPTTMPEETNLEKVDSDLDFYKRPALGNLIFRTYNGEFINKQYLGEAAMGKAMSELDDLYLCSASRYYRFLTGINVELRDFNDPMSPGNETADEIKYRNLIISLGKKLKESQSVNKMIEEIIASPLYITPGKVN